MPVYVEKIRDKKTGKMIDKTVDGKKQYFIRTYVTDEFGNSKQITRHNKNWLGIDGKKEAGREETRLNHFCEIDETNQVKTYPDNIITKFNKDIYQAWQNEMRQKKYKKNKYSKKLYDFSISYLNDIHNEICNMIDYGIINGFCSINFAKQVGKIGTPKEIKLSKRKKEYIVIDFEEFKKLMQVTKDNDKYNVIFDLWFSRGPRPGEIRAFRICDYNEKEKQLMVNFTMSKNNILKDPKTASSKAPIDLDDTVNEKIKKLIDYWKTFSDYNENWYLFNGPTPISSNALENAKNKYFKLAEIDKHIKLHEFRHSCASWLLSLNIPIQVISKILRHKNVDETLKTYAHLLKHDYQNALIEINNYKENYQEFQKTRPKTRPKFI